MTALLPNPSLLRIGQAAKATGCTPKALRLYEARGLIPPAIRQGQYRYYHAEHLRFKQRLPDFDPNFVDTKAINVALAKL